MQKHYSVLFRIFFIVFFSNVSFAQQNKDYSIFLNSGKFTPVENGKSISYTSQVFKKSLFGNSHYLVLQFSNLPTDIDKKTLLDNGIKLLDYIPTMPILLY